MAASGTTKKSTINQLLGSGGTATLASATITGDLTVRTTRLTTTTTGVGIGTATPILPLDVRGTAGAGALFLKTTDPAAPVASAYIQTPVSTGFSSTVPMYGFWYQNCGMGNPAAENLSWIINSSEAMRLNSTGLGVGMTPASSQSRVQIYQALGTTVNGALHITDNATTSFLFNNTSSGVSSIWTSGALTFSTGSNAYSTNGARMTLDASGNLLVGQTTAGLDANGGIWVRSATSIYGSSIIINHPTAVGTGNSYSEFTHNGIVIGSISQNGTTGVLYNISSDYRLKEAVQPITDGLSRINALKPSIYKWKSDGSAGEGFLAHELAEVVPFAVTGKKDAVNEDGSIKSQGIDMSRIVPILVAAIKELTARVEALEA
jgi:hypothetical protein